MSAQVSLTTGGQCNGAGDVVVVDGTDYCLCHDLYSGGSDFFDTRFVALPSHPELSLTCSSSRVGEWVVWGMIFIGIFYRLYHVRLIWREKYAQLVTRTPQLVNSGVGAKLRAISKNFALRLLSFDYVVLFPVCTVAVSLKLAGHIMGTDPAVTVFYVMIPMLFQWENSHLAAEEFKVITRFMPQQDRARLSKLRSSLEAVSWAAYCVGACLPTVAALFLDKHLGPLANGEYVTILVRNLFIVFWSAFASVANYVVLNRFEHVMATSLRLNNTEAMDHMRKANKKLVIMYAGIALTYLVFCLPHLWAFQTYCYAIIVFLGTFRHPAAAFKSIHTFTGADSSKTGVGGGAGTGGGGGGGGITAYFSNNNVASPRQSDMGSNFFSRPSDMGSNNNMLLSRPSDMGSVAQSPPPAAAVKSVL